MLLVATFEDAGALPPLDDEAEATLPAGMRALGLVALADELRPEAGDDARAFTEAGVAVKVISGDDPETVVALARQAGLGDAASISGPELDDLDDEALAKRPRRDDLRADHAAAEGAAGRRAARAATTWR